MPQHIEQLTGPSWAPATFVTVGGSPVLAQHPVDMRFQRRWCSAQPDPYLQQRVFMPDYWYFKRWQCRANAYDEAFEAFNRQKNMYWMGKNPSAPEAFV